MHRLTGLEAQCDVAGDSPVLLFAPAGETARESREHMWLGRDRRRRTRRA